jgi:hypothetical protein
MRDIRYWRRGCPVSVIRETALKFTVLCAAAVLALAAAPAFATGLATCESGPESGWTSQDALKQKLADQGWRVRRIKVDGGCY